MIKGVLLALTCVAAVWFLQPWTVRRIDEVVPSSGQAAIDPAAFAAELWRTSLIPALNGSAVDARTLLDAIAASAATARQRFGREDGSGSWYVAVRGSGQVVSVSRDSSRGVAALDVPPYDGRPDVALQIGPAISGTGLRDVTTLAPFSTFTNQLQFADVANALNDRAAQQLAPDRARLAVGQIVTFVGVAGKPVNDADRLSPIVPVQLTVEGSGRE